MGDMGAVDHVMDVAVAEEAEEADVEDGNVEGGNVDEANGRDADTAQVLKSKVHSFIKKHTKVAKRYIEAIYT